MDQGSSRRRGILATVLAFPVVAGVATAGYVDGWFDPGAAFITGTAAPPAVQPPPVVTDLRGQDVPIPGPAVPPTRVGDAVLPELGPAEDDAEAPRPAGTGPEDDGPGPSGADDGGADDGGADDGRPADDGPPADDGTNEDVGDDGADDSNDSNDGDAGDGDGDDDAGNGAGDDDEGAELGD